MRRATWPSTARRFSRRSGRSASMTCNQSREEDTVRRVTRNSPHYPAPGFMGDLAMESLRLVWRFIQLLLLTFLVILQPVVGLVFGGLALLGVLMSFFFKLSGAAPHFP